MEFRAIKLDEYLEACSLQAHAFFNSFDREKLKNDLENEETDHWSTIRAAFDDSGKMQACMNLLPYEVWFDGNVVGMGGIGGVATLPEYRRSGNIRQIFSLVFDEMYQRGDIFSYLYPFSHEYYRKFGYELNQMMDSVKGPLLPLLSLSQPGRAEQYQPECIGGDSDPGPIVEIYNQWASRHNLTLDRDGRIWRKRLELDPITSRTRSYVWYDEKDTPCGYVQFKREEGDENLQVLDMAWSSKEGLLGVMGFLGRMGGNIKTMTCNFPPSIAAELFWSEMHDVKVEKTKRGMNRIINASQAFSLMRKPSLGEGHVTLSVEDEMLPQNTGVYILRWKDGSAAVEKTAPGPADLTCSIASLSPLITGYMAFDQWVLRPDVSLENPDKLPMFQQLFTSRPIAVVDYF